LSFGLNYGRYIDANGNLQKIADAKSDLSKQWAFTAMGVSDYATKDPAQIAIEMALKAREIYLHGNKSEQYLGSRGATTFYSMEDLRSLGAQSEAQIRSAQRGYNNDRVSAALSDETQRQWQEFAVSLERAGLNIRKVFVDALTPVIKNLPDLSNEISEVAKAFFENRDIKQWIGDLSGEIKVFAQALKEEDFVADFKEVTTDLKIFGEAIHDLAMFISKFLPHGASGTPGAPAGAGKGGRIDLLNPKNWEKGLGILSPDVYGGGKPLGMSKYEMALAGGMVQNLMRTPFGLTQAESAGLVASDYAESGFKPQWGHGDEARGKKNEAYGIGQWHDDRLALFKKLFHHDMWATKDPIKAISEQLYFQAWELRNNRKNAMEAMAKHPNDPQWAGAAYSKYGASPGDVVGNMQTRAATAQRINIYLTGTTGSEVSTQAVQARAGP